MATLLLKNILGTRFITKGNLSDVNAIVTNPDYADSDFDICDCVISRDIANFIEQHPEYFCDSKDPERGRILELNRTAAHNRLHFKLVPVESIKSSKDVVDYIKTLSPDVIYHVDSAALMPIGALIYVLAPNIRLTFGYLTGDLGRYLSEALYNHDPDILSKYVDAGTLFLRYDKKLTTPVTLTRKNSMYLCDGAPLRTNPVGVPAYIPACIGNEHVKSLLFNYSEFIKNLLRQLDAQSGDELSLYDVLTSW